MTKEYQNIPGKTYILDAQECLERLESLEHLSNQHDILLNAVLDILLKNMGENGDTSHIT